MLFENILKATYNFDTSYPPFQIEKYSMFSKIELRGQEK